MNEIGPLEGFFGGGIFWGSINCKKTKKSLWLSPLSHIPSQKARYKAAVDWHISWYDRTITSLRCWWLAVSAGGLAQW